MACDPVIEAARLAAQEMPDRVGRGIDLSFPDCFEISEYSPCLGVRHAAGYHPLIGHLGRYVDQLERLIDGASDAGSHVMEGQEFWSGNLIDLALVVAADQGLASDRGDVGGVCWRVSAVPDRQGNDALRMVDPQQEVRREHPWTDDSPVDA